jgi:hypothetical protein
VTKYIYFKKVIPLVGRGDQWDCEILRDPHCLNNQLTDGGDIVNPTHRKRYFSVSGTHFRCEPQGLLQLEGLGRLKKFTSSGLEPVTFGLVA